LWEYLKALRRKEARIAPFKFRGRVYEKKPARGSDGIVAKSLPKGRISARVWRAATGKWENLGVISEPSREN
jgi:hypothetical protein